MVQPDGEDDPTMGNPLFGMPTLDQAHEMCEILESIAPNVNEMQLFTDDSPEECVRRKFLSIVSILFYITPFRGKCSLPPFTFSPFITSPPSPTCHRFDLRSPGPLNSGMLDRVPVALRDLFSVIPDGATLYPDPRVSLSFTDSRSRLLTLCSGDRTLRLPRFRRLNSVTVHVPGPRWSDLIYDIAAWFAGDRKLPGEIAESACQEDLASPSPSADPSLPSATRASRWENSKKTRVRFAYPVGKGDIDWRKLESAVLGEGFEGLDGGFDCARFGNRGEGGIGGGNDADDMVMRINRGKSQAGGGCGKRAGSLWVEVGNGSAALGEVRGELVRLDQLGLLQVSCR